MSVRCVEVVFPSRIALIVVVLLIVLRKIVSNVRILQNVKYVLMGMYLQLMEIVYLLLMLVPTVQLNMEVYVHHVMLRAVFPVGMVLS